MNNYGFFKVASATPLSKVADVKYNSNQISDLIKEACDNKASLIVFPELCICSYSCADLFRNRTLLESSKNEVLKLAKTTKSAAIVAIVGLPISNNGKIFNVSAILAEGEIKGFIPKTSLNDCEDSFESRWFAKPENLSNQTICFDGKDIPFGVDLAFKVGDALISAEIGEDTAVPSHAKKTGANVICNLSASSCLIGKRSYRENFVKARCLESNCGYIFSSAGVCESTTDALYSGHCLIGENGCLLNQKWQEDFENQIVYADLDLERIEAYRYKNTWAKNNSQTRIIDINLSRQEFKLERKFKKTPFIPLNPHERNQRMEEVLLIQSLSLAKRLKHTGLSHPVIGISGGLDSTLALLVCVKAMDKLNLPRKNIIGITMPGFGTTKRTYSNSHALMESLGITIKEIDITNACKQHFKDIGHDENVHDVTFENTQARERTQILFDIANKCGGLVIGTGDLSEIALGWATYGGDHISMYNVNCSVPKTLVRYLVLHEAQKLGGEAEKILLDILDTPVSPELLPPDKSGDIAQETENLLGDYVLHDFYLYHFVRFGFSAEKIKFLAMQTFLGDYSKEQIEESLNKFISRFFSQQFKRSCSPDGPKIGTVSLSPRGAWNMASDCSSTLWLDEL